MRRAGNRDLRRILPEWAAVTALALSLGLFFPESSAQAGSGKTFWETIGISIAVGTVLGASTLPFYDEPGNHLKNLAYGASAGAAVGLLTGLYLGIAKKPQEDDLGAIEPRSVSPRMEIVQPRPSTPTAFWTPVVSLNW